MACIEEMIPVCTVTVFPGAPKKYGGQKKGESRDPFFRRLGCANKVIREVSGTNGIETVSMDGKMIEAIIYSGHGATRYIDFSGVKRAG
jgi:hypothetical protein